MAKVAKNIGWLFGMLTLFGSYSLWGADITGQVDGLNNVTPVTALIGSAEASNAVSSQTVDQLGPVIVGQTFPTFGGHTLSGGYLSLKELENHGKYVVVSYFATWCAPCRVGLPKIERFVNQHDDVVAVYIALGERQYPSLQRFVNELKINSEIVVDKFETIGARHGVAGEGRDTRLPRTFILNPDGTVRKIFVIEGDDFEEALENSLK